jgi:hypothetical protein
MLSPVHRRGRLIVASTGRQPDVASGETGPSSRESAHAAAAQFENTRWSILLKLDEGGQTLLTAELLPEGKVAYGNGGEDGTWQVRQGFIVIKQPVFLFGNDVYYSGRIVKPHAARSGEPTIVRLADGLVETDKSRKLVRIGSFSAHQILVDDEDADDYDEDNDISRILD